MSTQKPQTAAPSLASLTARFIRQRSADSNTVFEDCPSVEPHEAPSGFRVDGRATWSEALVAVRLAASFAGVSNQPAGWSGFTRSLPSRFAVVLCVGNFPQMLGDVSRFADAQLSDLAATSSTADADTPNAHFWEKATKGHPELALLAVAAGHRLAGEYERADAALAAAESRLTGPWRSVWENERAALLWDSGDRAGAVAAWELLPDVPVKAFNLGMAALFANQPDRAKELLTSACRGIPESSGWNHLARLYIALCDR